VSISQHIYSFELFISSTQVLQKFCAFADEKLPKLKNKKYTGCKPQYVCSKNYKVIVKIF